MRRLAFPVTLPARFIAVILLLSMVLLCEAADDRLSEQSVGDESRPAMHPATGHARTS